MGLFSDQSIQNLLDGITTPVLVCSSSPDHQGLPVVVLINAAAVGLLGSSSTDLPLDLRTVIPEIKPEQLGAIESICQDQAPTQLTPIGLVGSGAHSLDLKAQPLSDGLCSLHVAPLERERVSWAERNAAAFVEDVLEHIPAMVFMKEAKKLSFVFFNRAGEQLLGLSREQILGKTDYDFFPSERADAFVAMDRQVLERRKLQDIPEEPIQTANGERWLHTRKIPLFDAQGQPQYLLGVSLDITPEKRARDALRASHDALERDYRRSEEALRQSQKLEALGRLAGGIAHDFNNLLSVILSYSTLALDVLGPETALATDLEEVRSAAERAAALTRQLLAFSRRQVLNPRVVDVNHLISNTDRMLQRLIGARIQLTTKLRPGPLPIKVDPNQIEQVLMNLVVNASDAMPDGGDVWIETDTTTLSPTEAGLREVTTGPYATISVTDTGSGIDADTLQNIFEPFFTTKGHGRGTGLGLSTVFGIVRQSGGHVLVKSQPGKGACFTVFLPITYDRLTPSSQPRIQVDLRGHESILLVEDEAQVLQVASEILSRNGYSVLETQNAVTALEVLERSPVEPDLLITDVILPGLTGPELVARVRAARPSLKVLYMSGYTNVATLPGGVFDAKMPYLQKPFTPETLLSKVREVLDKPR